MKWITEKKPPEKLAQFSRAAVDFGNKIASKSALCTASKAAAIIGCDLLLLGVKTFVVGIPASLVVFAALTFSPSSAFMILENQLGSRNPNELVFVAPSLTEDKFRFGHDVFVEREHHPHTEIVTGAKAGNLDETINQASQAAQKKGTLDEVSIMSHGGPKLLELDKNKPHVHISDALNMLYNEQMRIGKQITKRIVFDACDVFGDLSDEQVRYFSSMSRLLHTEIVGTTTRMVGLVTKGGHYCRFTPDGRVSRDIYDSPTLLTLYETKDSEKWFEKYKDKKIELSADEEEIIARSDAVFAKYGKPERVKPAQTASTVTLQDHVIY